MGPNVLPPQEFEDGPWSQQNLDAGAGMIIPVPSPAAGAVVVGENVITYFNSNQPPRSASLRQNIMRVSVVCVCN